MYWGCSGELGHHPCKVSDSHTLSFISIVGKNYAKSAEKANFAIFRCGKWALWKNWSIDIQLMYWGCSGDLGHHPCKVSDPHPLSFISIVGKNYAKSAEKANFAILRCGKWALWKNWSIDIGLMYWGCSGDLGHHPCKVSDAHPLSFISIVGKKCLKSKFCHITVRQMGAVEKLVHRYWVDVLGVLRGPRASSLQSFRSSSSFLHIDSWPKLCKKCWKSKFCHITVRQMGTVEKLVHRYWVDVLGCSGDLGHHPCRVSDPHPLSFISIVGKNYAKSAEKANFAILRCGKWALWKNWSIDIGLMYWGCSGDLGHHPCKVSDAHPLSFISIVGEKCWKSKFCHITVRQMGAVEKLVHRYWVDVLGVLRGPRASSLQSFRSSSSFLHIDSWPKLCKKCWKSKFCHITVRQMGAVEKLVHRYWVDVLGVLRGPRASSLQSFRSSSSFLHIDSWQKLCKKCWKSKFCHITVRQMGAVEKLVHRY